MKVLRTRLATCLMLATAGVFGCAESPGPMAPPTELGTGSARFDHSTITDAEVTVLERNDPLGRDIVKKAHIGRDGGDIKIIEAGLQVSFPAGAVSELTEFTIIARAGKGLIYEFYPSPKSFTVPVKIEQSLKGTTAYKNSTLMSKLEGAYFPGDAAAEYSADGTVKVTELIPVDLEVKTSKIKFFVHHFSGYLVASGRSDTY